ncbi:MAG: hypothetical protein ACYC5A_11150, partial [Thermoleophilia bacterium]
MQIRSRLLFRTAIVILGVVLCLGLLLSYGLAEREAKAISATEWDTVRIALNNYVTNQYESSAATEYGFVIDSGALKSRIDSNGDGTYLGEGDDAGNNPVIVDVLISSAGIIPTTVSRSNWNTTSLQSASVNSVAAFVNSHEAAGFSTDVVVYCLTGHTEAAAAGGFGAIAGAGGLGGSSTPKVLSLKYGRAGWGPTTNTKTFTATNTTGAPDALPSAYANATQADATCNGKTGSELVRCVAERAVSATGGSVGNGVNPPVTTYQAIDLRPGGGTTIEQTNATYNIPVNTIFNSGLNYLNPAATPKKLFVGDTQHMAGMVATGAEMLGYDSAFLQWGLANYNKNIGEIYDASDNFGYAQQNVGANVAAPLDTTAPTVTVAPAASNVTDTTADISRTANEPATMKVEYGTAAG